jgi:hypothetical protein
LLVDFVQPEYVSLFLHSILYVLHCTVLYYTWLSLTIITYTDGERCGATLISLFENAENPEKVFVGLVEHNAPQDKFCLEVYCNSYNSPIYKRQTVREGMVKIMTRPEGREGCPFYDNVRLIAYHDIQAKGPIYSRSLARKALGNEEFCMQIDAHTTFVKGWDDLAVEQWKQTQNEFGILSNVPVPKTEEEAHSQEGEHFTEVPRQCSVKFQENGFPVSR